MKHSKAGDHAVNDLEATALQRALFEVAFQVADDVDATASDVVPLQARAMARLERTGEAGLWWQARLVSADADGRRGRTARLGSIAKAALVWAESAGDDFVIARAHRLLSTFHEVLGDAGAALEHAVASVQELPEGLPGWVDIDHQTRMGIALLRLHSFEQARERFNGLLVKAESVGDTHTRVRMLNNLAYVELGSGRDREALDLAEQMVRVSHAAGLLLSAANWDTLAAAQMRHQDWSGAESTLTAALGAQGCITEAIDIASLHVNLAICYRHLHRVQEAIASLELAAAQCEQRDLGEMRTVVLRERAEVAAAAGDFEDAYHLHCRFHAMEMERLSERKDVHARILAAVYETAEARRSGERYRRLAERDHLTGLYNRRHLEHVAPNLLLWALADEGACSLALLDIDHFKLVNDAYSHQVGDLVLQTVAQLFDDALTGLLSNNSPQGAEPRAPMRVSDESGKATFLLARLGGEEFVVLLPRQDAPAAQHVVGEVLQSLRDQDWSVVADGLKVTASAGVSTTGPGCTSLSGLLAAADQRLYAAKRGGRDRFVGSLSI